MTLLFICNPFIAYLVFKNKGAFEVSFVELLHIYGYSYTIFIPVAFLYLVIPLYNMRLFILLSSGAISLYYLFKETKEIMNKYFDDGSLK
jgi:hypothetical protein